MASSTFLKIEIFTYIKATVSEEHVFSIKSDVGKENNFDPWLDF